MSGLLEAEGPSGAPGGDGEGGGDGRGDGGRGGGGRGGGGGGGEGGGLAASLEGVGFSSPRSVGVNAMWQAVVVVRQACGSSSKGQ